LDVASTVRGARSWRRGLDPLREELPALVDLADHYLSDHSGLAESIHEAIGDGGEVLDAASPTLARIRSELRGAHDRLVARLRDLMGVAPYRDAVQDPVVTQRAGRYVIPIKAESRGQVPGIVHDQSASGATLFIEPLAAVELGNRWRTLQVEEEREVERILRALSQEVGEEAEQLSASVDGLAQLDLAQAKARLAGEQRATAPTLVTAPRPAGEPVLRLVEARHPLLTGRVVPVSLELGADFDLLLITGPNTGGKTVALKTAGLLTLMAQAGLHIPAQEGSLVAVFQRVQADIGDEQSLQQSLSTFSSHVTRIVRMLDEADGASLILLDELGAGTDPQEGAALARALLTYLQERGAYVIATTHYPELKAFAHLTPRVQNASVEFNVETLSPTYRLMVGTPGRSNALAIARRLGMPETILGSAQANLAPRTAEVEAMLAEIAHERAEADAAHKRAEREAARAYETYRQSQKELRDARRLRKETWDKAQAEANEALLELRREAHRLRQQMEASRSRRLDAREAMDAALDLQAFQAPEEPAALSGRPATPAAQVPLPASLQVGAEVMVPRLGLPGRVTAVRDGQAEVEVLGRRVRMPASDLQGAARPTAADRRAAGVERVAPVVLAATPRGDISITLDLRGQRRDEALERLEEYLEDASLAGLPTVRIVHGKGTGAIRQAVRDELRSSPYVERFAPEPDGAGGDGATAVWLR
jgi:DNA mismatch repair protein MutS2